MASIITLLTDFGIEDGYVASMKGVILGICPQVSLVDISHMIAPQDVRAGAYLISTVYEDFPSGTIHLAVVDPGVGTERRAMALKAAGHFFVGPDNGLFSLTLKEQPDYEARCLENPIYWRSKVSNTFHGRDIFAPAAAHLASGIVFDSLGPPCIPMLPQWSSVRRSKNKLQGEVIYIDHFGNIITNLRQEDVARFAAGKAWAATIGSHSITQFVESYGQVEPGDAVALIGSSGHLEIAVNQGSAAEILKIRTGDRITLQTIQSDFKPSSLHYSIPASLPIKPKLN